MSNDIAPNGSTTEGDDEMNKNEVSDRECSSAEAHSRAYELWNQGRPHGCDLINWREAEQEIMDCLGPTQMDSARDALGLLRD